MGHQRYRLQRLLHDKFARNFLLSINIAGVGSIAFLVYTLFRPYVFRGEEEEESLNRAKEFVHRFGNSSLDYFKYSADKLFYFTNSVEGFIAYRIAGNYAVVLENPVCKSKDDIPLAVREFDGFCYQNGLMPLFYRVPEECLNTFRNSHKKAMISVRKSSEMLNVVLRLLSSSAVGATTFITLPLTNDCRGSKPFLMICQ